MAIYEQDVVMFETKENGDKVIKMPISRANNIEGIGRSANTAYVVGDVVYVDNNKKVALKCTTAGTTSNAELNISNKNIGDTVTDGSVVWVVAKRDLTDNFANYLPLSGGVMTGAIQTASATIIRGVDNTNGIRIYGGTNNNDGAYIRLLGNAINDTNGYDGGFAIYTNDLEGKGPTLLGLPNGTFQWDGKKIAFQGALSMPYTGASGITISASALTGDGYAAPNDGWVAVSFTSTSDQDAWLRLYNTSRQALSVVQFINSYSTGRLLMPVAKNGRIKAAQGTAMTIATAYFYPAQSEV